MSGIEWTVVIVAFGLGWVLFRIELVLVRIENLLKQALSQRG